MSRAHDERRVIQAVMDTWTPVPVIARIAGVSDRFVHAYLRGLYEAGDRRIEYVSRRLDSHNPTAFYRRTQRQVRANLWDVWGFDVKDGV